MSGSNGSNFDQNWTQATCVFKENMVGSQKLENRGNEEFQLLGVSAVGDRVRRKQVCCDHIKVLVVCEPSDPINVGSFDNGNKLVERLLKDEYAQREMEASFQQLQRNFSILETYLLKKESERLIHDASNVD